MLRGQLDNITSSGYVEGWAFDTDEPLRALQISILSAETEIAWGMAHRFRKDLLDAGCGTGWNAFRLRIDALTPSSFIGPFRLMERTSKAVLQSVDQISVIADTEVPIRSLEALTASDPTLISEVWQLRGCEQVLLKYIQREGVETFVRDAYLYILGRQAEPAGLTIYSRSIRQSTLSPVGVLEALADTDEFRSLSRKLGAPNSSMFPFW